MSSERCPCGNRPEDKVHSPSCPEKWTRVMLKAPCAMPKIVHWKPYNISFCTVCGWAYPQPS